MKRVILVLALVAATLLVSVPSASATGPSFVQFGCRSGGGEATYNVASADAANSVYGVPWSVRAVVGHYRGGQNACQTGQAVGAAATFETTITVQRLVYTDWAGMVWVDCGVGLDRWSSGNGSLFDVHYDAGPNMVDVCRRLNWPVGYTRAVVSFRVIESPNQPEANIYFVINF